MSNLRNSMKFYTIFQHYNHLTHRHHFSISAEFIDFTKLPQTSLSPIALPRSLKSIPVSLDITSGYVNLQLFRLPVEFKLHYKTKLYKFLTLDYTML